MRKASKTLRAGGLATLLFTSALTAPALAQQLQSYTQIDGNGVDLLTGQFYFSMTEGTIGSGLAELALVRNWAGPANGWTDNWTGILYTSYTGSIVVEFGTYADTFGYAGGGVFVNAKANGATLAYTDTGYRYTAPDGTQIDFLSTSTRGWDLKGHVCVRSPSLACSIPTSIRRPNGMTYTLNWAIEERCGQYDFDLNCVSNPRGYVRLESVWNSANYVISFDYVQSSTGSEEPSNDWFVRSGAQFGSFAGAPAAAPTVSYEWPSPTAFEVTDAGGQTWRFSYVGAGARLTGIRRPGATSDTTTITYSTSFATVASVVRDGIETTYNWDNNLVVTTPAGETEIILDSGSGRIGSVTDPLNRTTSYDYDSNGRLTRVTQPKAIT